MGKTIQSHSWTAFSELEGTASNFGTSVQIQGWVSPFDAESKASYFALVEEASCCLGCLPRDADRRIEVFAAAPIPVTGRRLRLKGRLRKLVDDQAGWRYQLLDATVVELPSDADSAFNRRQVLKAATLACLAIASLESARSAQAQVSESASESEARHAIEGMATIDVHSHAGGVIGLRRVEAEGGFLPVAAPMREGGMAVLCLAIVSDSPTHHLTEERRIRPFREPEPGELYAYGQRSFRRVHKLAQAQGIALVRDATGLSQARSGQPSIVVSAEGADFLEGRPERLDEAYDKWALRHLQLTHYRVNELGDIQTEPAVHGGLTAVGAEVIARCNRLGIVVDVAHGTFDLVKQAAAVTTKPLVLSHTSLASHPGPRSRLVSVEHARVVAETGGVVGIWPPESIFPDMAALATGMAKMADAIGVEHVALGSDMRGLVGASTFDSYQALPLLAKALLAHGFQVHEVRKILGGNYLRVFIASMAEPEPFLQPGRSKD